MSRSARFLEIRLEHLQVRRAGRRVLRDITWRIRPGEHWLLAGANGAGKTQLLKILAGSVWPEPAARPARRYLSGGESAIVPAGFMERIAYLGAERQDQYQRYGWDLPAARIVGTGIYRTDIPLDVLTAADRRRVQRALGALGAAHLAARPFLSLSYGERRVILLARALVSRPQLLLLDEILNGLDASNRGRILAWLARQTRRLPWVFATHRIEDVPAAVTHALILSGGRIVYRGPRTGAPLAKWLGAPVRLTSRALRRRGRAGRALLRLTRGRVYLDQSRALEGVSLAVRSGECWVVHGRNGSGKTTLLRTLYGDHGVALGGTIARAGVTPGVPLEAFKRRVGLVAPHLQAEYPRESTVAEVVQSGRHASIGLNDAPSAADRDAARRALGSFGLTRHAARPLRELSYGQVRRALFARAWVRKPRLLLLDEPFAGIDAPTRRRLMRRVETLAARGAAVMVAVQKSGDWPACATHELELSRG
ncbi:MAG: ATP-binding cassette domain-containing protein, partial [Steroidobacteraceae bacterium]